MKPVVSGPIAALMLLIGASASFAQPTTKLHRIGIVSPLQGSPEPPTVRAFRHALADLGYVEGKTVIVEARYAQGRTEIFPELVAGLINSKVDVIVAGSSLGALSAKRATSTIPIVFAGLLDPVAAGLVTSLARPGANITGATYGAGGAAIGGKWLELLKEAVPRMTHAAVLFNSAEPASMGYLAVIDAAARTLKVNVDRFDARDDAMLRQAFSAIGASPAQGLIVVASGYFGGNRAKIVRSAAEKRLPTIYFASLFPEVGGLMSYGGSLEDSYRRTASYVDRILKGAKPADLPVDQATKYELLVNMKTARTLGIDIPRSLLARADRVIE